MDNVAKKIAYCRYDTTSDIEKSVECIRIFLPAAIGYINYNVVHSVYESKNCDTWRLGKAYAFDDNFENEYELTPKGAEWDMALRLDGRPDFIGGYAHGDEIFSSIAVELDGKRTEPNQLCELTCFDKLVVTVDSVGYDPDDFATPVLKHFKEYIISEEGITLNQRVEWLGGFTLGASYMAMMPPLKSLTDTVYTDVDPAPKEAISNYGSASGATVATVCGRESGFSFSMSIPRYPSLVGGNRFLLTDNKGKPYNKMYFIICKGAEVSMGDIWETTTKYSITNGNTFIDL